MVVPPMQPEHSTRLWEQVLGSVKNRLGSHQAFDTWFVPIVPIVVSPSFVELEVPNAFFVDWIHEHHLPVLCQSLEDVLGCVPDVRFAAREALPPSDAVRERSRAALFASAQAVAVAEPPVAVAAAPPVSIDSQLHPRLTFETFVVGGSNRFTHAACLAVAQNPGHAYNPLFIFGGSGLGKTHLLHAIGHAVRHARPDARVCYVSAERFTNEM